MGFDVNKIIQESVKSILDSDGDILNENLNIDENKKNEDGEIVADGTNDFDYAEIQTESINYFKEYFKESKNEKK